MTGSIWTRNWRTRILQVIGLVLKYQSSIIFQFRLFPGKTNEIFFSKNSQNPIIRPFSAFFAQILTEMNFSGKKGLYHFLNIPVIYHCAKNPKTNNDSFLKQTDRQTFFWKKGSVSFWILQLSTTVQKRKNNNDPFLKDRPRDFFMEKSVASFWILQLSTIVQKIQKK